MQLRRVVVTGLGAITPIGNTLQDYWEGLRQGKPGAGLITKFNTEKFKVKFACEVKDFDATQFLDKKEARKMDPFTHYAMVAADEAVQDSGITQGTFNPDRIGVIWGAGIGGFYACLD